MPPLRTMPTKPLKTERTHEENQERAYIAASRRSDRSLEARMESARRASEIHKKRTGRALRVTEQDVINEEMYEEEDEDLDAQIRRLTSHMGSASPEFNRRIHNLLTAQSAIRMAFHNPSANQYSNGASFAPNPYIQNMQTMQMQNLQYSQSMQQMQAMQMQQMQNFQNMQNMSDMQNSQTINPHMMAASQMRSQPVRHSPYPMMQQAMRQSSHQRSASMATGMQGQQPFTSSPSPATSSLTEEQRRMSLPASQRPSLSRNSSSVHTIKMESPRPAASSSSRKSSPSTKDTRSPDELTNAFYSTPTTPIETLQTQSTLNPLTTSLPTESQMILGSQLTAADPKLGFLMEGSDIYNAQYPLFPSDATSSSTKPQQQASNNAMDSTLFGGMSMLNTNNVEPQSATFMSSASTDSFPTFSPNDDLLFDSSFDQSTNLTRNNSNQGSNSEEWGEFFDDSAFDAAYQY